LYPFLDYVICLAFLLLIPEIIVIDFFAEKVKEKRELFKIMFYNYSFVLIIILIISIFYIVFLPWSSIEIPFAVFDYIIKYSIFLFISSLLIILLYYGLSPISYILIFKGIGPSSRIVISLKKLRTLASMFNYFLKHVLFGFIIFLIMEFLLFIFLNNIFNYFNINFTLYPIYRMPSHPGLQNYILTHITRLSTLLTDFISVIVFSRFLRKYINSLWMEVHGASSNV